MSKAKFGLEEAISRTNKENRHNILEIIKGINEEFAKEIETGLASSI